MYCAWSVACVAWLQHATRLQELSYNVIEANVDGLNPQDPYMVCMYVCVRRVCMLCICAYVHAIHISTYCACKTVKNCCHTEVLLPYTWLAGVLEPLGGNVRTRV